MQKILDTNLRSIWLLQTSAAGVSAQELWVLLDVVGTVAQCRSSGSLNTCHSGQVRQERATLVSLAVWHLQKLCITRQNSGCVQMPGPMAAHVIAETEPGDCYPGTDLQAVISKLAVDQLPSASFVCYFEPPANKVNEVILSLGTLLGLTWATSSAAPLWMEPAWGLDGSNIRMSSS